MSAKPLVHRKTHIPDTSNSEVRPRLAVPAELESVDTRLGRLRDEVLPSAPYLLTVPTDVPFRLGNRFVNNWAVGKKGPFAIEEQQLQYMTFLMHHDPDSLLVAVGDWSDNGDERAMARQSEGKSRVATPTTPAVTEGAAAKKKISLSDYKTRAKGDPTREQSSGSQDNPPDATRHEKSDTLQVPTARNPRDQQTRNRSDESVRGVSPNSKRPLKDSPKPPNDVPAPKRARLTPPEPVEAKSQAAKKPNGIPALLSPTLPPTSSVAQLPELLSPTLPPELEEELANFETESLTSCSKRDIPSISKNDTRNEVPNVKDSGHDRIRVETKSNNAATTLPKDVSKAITPAARENKDTEDSPEFKPSSTYAQKSLAKSITIKTNATSSNSAATSGPKKLVVRLKYGRANRKRVGALLKFGGKRTLSDGIASKTSKTIGSEDEDDVSESGSRSRERKRARSPDKDLAEERPPRHSLGSGKTLPSDEGKARAFKSPSRKQPPVAKSDPAVPTPAKDSRSKQRIAEGADVEVKTPLASSGGKSLPSKPERTVQTSPPAAPAANNRDQDKKAWRDEYSKYSGLGRELKHTADRYAKAKAAAASDQNSISDGKLAAAHGVESILCFIVAFILNDHQRSMARQISDSDTWRSIIAYWRVVEKMTSPYPHLHGLCLILGAVSHDTINSLDLERLAVCPLPGEQSPVPTPGSDGNTIMSSDRGNNNRGQNKKEFLDLRNRLPENHREANRLWLEGCRQLADDVLAKEFPETWSSRSRNFAERGHDRFKLGQYKGGFYLPFCRTTTPMEAVRFGVALLREWSRKEDIDFKALLKL